MRRAYSADAQRDMPNATVGNEPRAASIVAMICEMGIAGCASPHHPCHPPLHPIRQLELGRDARPLYRLLRRNPCKLDPALRWRVRCWLADKPALRELWAAKEALNRLYRIRAHGRAKKALTRLTDAMAFSHLPELRTLRKTLVRWRREVLAYFYCRLTNARTEGYNGKAKLVIRRAYGYKSFSNYRLRL